MNAIVCHSASQLSGSLFYYYYYDYYYYCYYNPVFLHRCYRKSTFPAVRARTDSEERENVQTRELPAGQTGAKKRQPALCEAS